MRPTQSLRGSRDQHAIAATLPTLIRRRHLRRPKYQLGGDGGEGQDAIAAKEKATYKRCDANLERGRVVPAEEAVLRRGIGDRTNDRSVSGGSASPSTDRWPAAMRSDSLAMRDPNTSVPLVLPVECARRISNGAACL